MNNINNPLSILFAIPIFNSIDYNKLLGMKYNIWTVASINRIPNRIKKYLPDLIVIDRELIRTDDDYNQLRLLSHNLIPILVAINSNDSEMVNLLKLGISGFLYKSMPTEILIHDLDNHVKLILEKNFSTLANMMIYDKLKEKSTTVSKLQTTMLGVLSDIIEFRDFKVDKYVLRIQDYLEIMIRGMIDIKNPYQHEVCLWDIHDHVISGQLHDIGKIGISDAILNKPNALTDEEYRRIQEHVNIGIEILNRIEDSMKDSNYLRLAKTYISTHHECWDGTGYPKGLKGIKIPLEGRIMAIIDTYDALVSNRPYKHYISHSEAVDIISKGAGTKFDPSLIEVFNQISNQFKSVNEI